MRLCAIQIHSLTHSLSGPVLQPSILAVQASKAGRGTNAINHAAVHASYLTSINAHVHTQPMIGHLLQTPAPPPKTIIADIEYVWRADVFNCDFRGTVSREGGKCPGVLANF